MRVLLLSVSMISLIVGSWGCSDSDSSVKVVNSIPQALITSHADGASMSDGDTVTFSGVGSDVDNDMSELQALWQTGADILCDWSPLDEGGNTACIATVTTDMTDITLVVRDPSEAADSVSISISVDATGAPTASITTPSSGEVF